MTTISQKSKPTKADLESAIANGMKQQEAAAFFGLSRYQLESLTHKLGVRWPRYYKMWRECSICSTKFFGHQNKVACSRKCAGQLARQRGCAEKAMMPRDVEIKLAWDVRMESALPWQRHPQAWDNVAYRKPTGGSP